MKGRQTDWELNGYINKFECTQGCVYCWTDEETLDGQMKGKRANGNFSIYMCDCVCVRMSEREKRNRKKWRSD